jgi:hypothetical protein
VAGDLEFLTDGVFVPTRGGWRELKLALFQKRERGEPADAAAWATRDLPGPAASAAFARLEGCDEFAARWRGWAAALGLADASGLTVVADGAAWIWAAAAEQFPGAAGLLDVFHACRHIGAAAAALFGEGTQESSGWADRVRQGLLADGWPGPAVGRGAGGGGRAAWVLRGAHGARGVRRSAGDRQEHRQRGG